HAFTPFAERDEPNIFAALSDPSKANMADRYFVSKLLEIFIVREMAARSTSSSSPYPITINCLNPGFCRSELGREAGWTLYLWGLVLARSPEVGSRTIVAAAEAGVKAGAARVKAGAARAHGAYMSEGVVAEPSELVRSEEGARVQRKVWAELVEKLEGITEGVTGGL
ncbi:MAG: hypothetical protein LQ348_007075, partial [Seirophora lacunosa]